MTQVMFFQAPSLLLWHAFGFAVTVPLLGWIAYSELSGRNWLAVPSNSRKNVLLFAGVLVISASWQISNPTFGADYQAAGGFVDILLKYGLSFYAVEGQLTTPASSAPTFTAVFPHNYVYGPVSVLIGSLISLTLDWTVLYRSVLVLFNLATGWSIFAWFGGRRGLAGSSLFLFNPLLHYTLNAGLNDSMMIGFLMIGVFLTYKGKSILGGVAFGLSLMTKQNAVFVVVPLIAWLYFRNRPRFVRFVTSFVAIVVALSLPFLLTVQSRTAYLEAVVEYPLSLSIQGKAVVAGQLANGLPNIGFSGIWSAMRSVDVSNPFVFSISPYVETSLVIAVVFLASRKWIGLADVSLLGYSAFLLGSKYLWNNHFVAFLPLAVLSMLAVSTSRFRVLLLCALVGGGLLYVILDGYSYLTGTYPPDYVVPDLVFFAILSAFFAWQVRGRTGSFSGQ